MHPLAALAILTWSLPLPLLLQLALAVVLPILVGLVTTRVTSANRKAVLLLALSFLTSFLTELLKAVTDSEPFDVGLWLLKAVGTFATGVAIHFGLFKPTGATAAAQRAFTKPKTRTRTPDQRGHATMRSSLLLLVVAAFLISAVLWLLAPRADAASTALFTNAADNPGSFDCYTYSGGAWHKLNDGDTAKITRSTPYKCDATYHLVAVGGRTAKLTANHAYSLGGIDVPLGWIVAVKGA